MRYLHFTTRAAARSIVAQGVIRAYGLTRDGVWAVAEGGYYLPWLQRYDSTSDPFADYSSGHTATRRQKSVAVLFETDAVPWTVDPEQVGWHGDVTLRTATIVTLAKARALLDTRWEHLRVRGWFDNRQWPQTRDYAAWAERKRSLELACRLDRVREALNQRGTTEIVPGLTVTTA